MRKADPITYDAVIIGAGIGGLVCGCCLAKAGMKTLIAERHYKPGGYCTSFTRQGFLFDAAAHSFGGYKYGNLGTIFNYLGVDKKIKVQKADPSDVIVTPDYRVSFWTDLNTTIDVFQKSFPDDAAALEKFFRFLVDPDPLYFTRIRSWTFKNLLDQFFTSDRLKAVLSFPLFGNGALPPSRMSAFIGAKIFKEFLLDGGYHPEGGMQALPNALAEIFKELGGELRLSTSVEKIVVQEKKVAGVTLESGEFLPSRYAVSNCDARQTFFKLLGKVAVGQPFIDTINSMVPSLSMFALYLGVDGLARTFAEADANIWYLSQYDLDKAYAETRKGDFRDLGRYLVYVSSNRSTVSAFLNAPYKDQKYWNDNKNELADKFIAMIERSAIPGLSRHILYRGTASPHTFFRYTLNHAGAAYGWESTPSQFADPDLRKPSCIQGLYLTGHWTTLGLGIPGVTYLGWDSANSLLKKHHLKVV